MADETFEGEESFAELFEESLRKRPRTVNPGERVTGTVVQVGAQRAYLDLGGGLDGIIELSELAAPGERPTVKPGDRIEAWVVRIQDRVAELALSLGKGAAAKAALEEAASTGVPIEGTVTAVNKGGYVVEAAGVRCFCPLGQMDVRRIDDPASLIGQKLRFRIVEWRGGRDVVLSRRALLEEEQAARAAKTRERLEPGARFTGTVTNVRDFGAFVDIGGLEGLVPASELGWGRLRPQDVVRPGQQVEVEVLRIEEGKDGRERIGLSMRSLVEDPFDATVDELPEGTIVEGTVTRIQPFGAFVEIVPGVEGLLHVSAFGRRIGHPSELVSAGQTVAVRVDAVDRGSRRISLSWVAPEELEEILAGEEAPAPQAVPPQQPGVSLRRQQAEPGSTAAAPAASGRGAKVLGQSVPKPAPAAEAEPASTAPADRPAALAPARVAVGDLVDVTVDKVEKFGVFVTWPGGRGLVPAAELGVPKGTDLRRAQPVGSTFRAVVTDIRDDGRIRLSRRAAEEAEERAEAAAWMERQRRPAGKGFATLGDLLKARLGK